MILMRQAMLIICTVFDKVDAKIFSFLSLSLPHPSRSFSISSRFALIFTDSMRKFVDLNSNQQEEKKTRKKTDVSHV